MKLRPRIFLALACLLLALPAPAVRAQSQDSITEEKALALIAALDRAVRAAKVNDIAPHLAADMRFKGQVEVAGRREQIEVGRDEFIAQLKVDFRKRLAYESKRYRTHVTISEDGQRAMVTSELFEKTTQREGTLSAASSEIYILKLRGGRLVVTSHDVAMRVLSFE